MSKRRIETKVSRTACYTCFSRACATRETDPRLCGPDTLAEVFLPPAIKYGVLSIPVLRKLFLRMMFPLGIYEYTLARTKLLDEVFRQALEDCFTQIVLLGAGFDTRALRFRQDNRGTTLFELDAPITQQAKRDLLARKHVSLPEQLVFVAVDFNTEQLADVLLKAGYQHDQPTLFLCEGVMMYLTPEAVDRTLAFIRDSAPEGSRVAFDYVLASVLRRENTRYGEHDIVKTVANAGEGWTFGLEEGAIDDFLTQRGFTLQQHYTPEELERRYFTANNGTVLRRINGTHCIVVASVVRENIDEPNR